MAIKWTVDNIIAYSSTLIYIYLYQQYLPLQRFVNSIPIRRERGAFATFLCDEVCQLVVGVLSRYFHGMTDLLLK